MLDAMTMLDKSSQKVLFIVDENYELKAALSDGDIRRWILSKGSLDAKVCEFANYSPKYLFEHQRKDARQFMLDQHIEAVPIVDEKMTIIEIERTFQLTGDGKKGKLNLPVVIMAGGLGTRLYPYTKILPKPLIPIGDLPVIQHIIDFFHGYGCNEFYIIVNHKKNMIKAYFSELEKGYHVFFIDEDTPLGTGGGLSLLKGLISRTFIFTNCDVLVMENVEKIYKQHLESRNTITMVCSLKDYAIPYGIIELGANGQIEAMTEKPHMSFFVNTGLYLVEPSVISEIEPNKPVGFPDVAKKLLDKGQLVGVYPVSESAWMDMGQVEGMDDMIERMSQIKR